jgi:phage-related protein
LDASSDFDDAPTVEQLNNRATQYITNNNLGLPFKDNLKINFVQLWQTEEYKSVAPLERVSLGDTVHVLYLDFNVSMKVISYAFDSLSERYLQMELGTKKASLASTITKPVEEQITNTVSTVVSNLENAIDRATQLISGGLGGYVVINTNAAGEPNEILIMDAPSIEEAVNVIRMNMNGIAFSSTGYSGDYTTSWTIDNHFNASVIDFGELNGNLIKAASVLTSALEVSAYDAVTGSIENITYDGSGMHIARKDPTTGTIVSDYQSLFTELGMRVMDRNGNVTLSAEQDTVDAVNLSAHKYFRVVDDASATNSRFQGFQNSIHNKFQFGIFWEK